MRIASRRHEFFMKPRRGGVRQQIAARVDDSARSMAEINRPIFFRATACIAVHSIFIMHASHAQKCNFSHRNSDWKKKKKKKKIERERERERSDFAAIAI
jgi:hypothetical protein